MDHNIKEFATKYNIKMCHSMPHYPQANGQVESSNKLVINLLNKKFEGVKERWVEELLGALWAIRTSSRGNTNETSFSLKYGTKDVIPTDIQRPEHYKQIN